MIYSFCYSSTHRLDKLCINIDKKKRRNNKTKPINLMNDAMFKALFRSSEARDMVASFLSSVTGIKKEILMNANYVGGELPKRKLTEKGKISDVVVLIDDHKRIIVEMNYSKSNYIFDKNASYAFSNILELTKPNMTQYPILLIININANNEFKTDKPILDFKIRDEENHIETEIYHSIHVILENIVNCKYNIDKEIKRFAEFLKTKSILELEEKFKGDENYMSAIRKIEDLSYDPEFAGQYDYEEAIEREKFECHLTGLEEGRKVGEKNQQIEIAKNLIKLGTVSIEDISESTGLTLEEINNLLS